MPSAPATPCMIFCEQGAGPDHTQRFSAVSHARPNTLQRRDRGQRRSRHVGYRSYWDGWSAVLRVTGALGMARLDPQRMREIDEAYDAFMARATEAYQSGDPPRQSECASTRSSRRSSTCSGCHGKHRRQRHRRAIRWFNSGDTVGAVYLLAGTGVNDIAQLPQDDAMQKKLRENVVKFFGEYGRYLDFQITLLAAIANAQASTNRRPARRNRQRRVQPQGIDIKARWRRRSKPTSSRWSMTG